MAKDVLTDEQMAMEIEQLKSSDFVKLAQKEIYVKSKRRKYLYQLRWLEKRGKELAAQGVTLDSMEAFLNEIDKKDGG